jgi:hypothetical protein
MPYIFESPEHAEWEDAFFWTPRTVERIIPEATSQGQQFKDTFGDDGDENPTTAATSTESSTTTSDQKHIIEYDTLKPRGELLLTRKLSCTKKKKKKKTAPICQLTFFYFNQSYHSMFISHRIYFTSFYGWYKG